VEEMEGEREREREREEQDYIRSGVGGTNPFLEKHYNSRPLCLFVGTDCKQGSLLGKPFNRIDSLIRRCSILAAAATFQKIVRISLFPILEIPFREVSALCSMFLTSLVSSSEENRLIVLLNTVVVV
jgi:hypothetical protein